MASQRSWAPPLPRLTCGVVIPSRSRADDRQAANWHANCRSKSVRRTVLSMIRNSGGRTMDEYEKLSQIRDQLEKLAEEIANLAKIVDKLRWNDSAETAPPGEQLGESP